MRMFRPYKAIGAVVLTLTAAGAWAALPTDVKMPVGGDINMGTINTDTSDRAPRATEPANQASTENPLWAISLKDLSATRERPIFSPSRRPPPAVVAAPFTPPPVPIEPVQPELSLIGTVAGIKQGFGIFMDKVANKTIRLKTGEMHEGWTLRDVRAREIVFQKKDVTVTLALPARAPTATTPPWRARR